MVKSFGDPQTTLRLRDILESIVVGVVNRIRPQPFNAEVTDIDLASRKAMVRTAGQTDPQYDIQVNFTQTLIPAQARAEDGSTSGNQVEVSGSPGAYWITKIFSGDWTYLNNV